MKITPTTVLDFKVAQPADLPIVVQILSEAAAWVQEKGIDQWPSPLNHYWRKRMAIEVAREEIYTAGIVNNRFAIVSIKTSNRHWPDDGLALYVGTLAIRRDMHGQGLGKHILTWAALKAQRDGKRFLRLDCLASNARLRQYYEEQGFEYRGLLESGAYVGAKYEQDVSTVM